jgi:hypothetical protein
VDFPSDPQADLPFHQGDSQVGLQEGRQVGLRLPLLWQDLP